MNPSLIFGKPDHGRSPFGLSYYGEIYSCARKANLGMAARALKQLETPTPDAPENPLDVGTAYHKLQEAFLLDEIGQDLVMDARLGTYTKSQQEALRLFRGWRSVWDSPLVKYGMRVTHAEHSIGCDFHADGTFTLWPEVAERLGGPLTGRLDFAGDIDLDGASKTFASTGILLPSPGKHGGDWKTSQSNFKHDDELFELSLQAQAYMWLWNLRNPNDLMEGFLFDKIARHKTLEAKSFSTYYVPLSPNAEQILSNYIQGAIEIQKANRPNPGSCIERISGRKCPFLHNGCERF